MASYWWWLAAAPLGVVVVGLLLTRPRKTLAGDMTEPMDLERGRAKSEAEMAAVETQVLTEADAGEAAALVGHFRELATDEQPIVHPVRRRHVYRRPARWQRVAIRRQSLRGFDADPLAAAIPGRHRVEEPVLFGAAVERWFAPQLATAPMPFPELPAEPEPGPAVDFTGSWTGEARRELAALLAADAEAGARR